MGVPTDQELQQIADGTNEPAAKVETPAGQVSGEQKQTPTPVAFKDDDLVEFTVNGEKLVKPYREVRDGWQRQEDYTRGKQAVAQRLNEVKELYEGLTSKQKELFDKEAAIDAVLGRTPRQQTPNQPNDDDVVPVGQIKSMVADMLKKEREETNQSFAQQQAQAAQTATYARWEEKVSDAVDRLQKEHPVLAHIPNLIAGLKIKARADNPQTEQELVAAILKAGKQVAASIDGDYSERSKRDAIKRKEMRDKGPEPSNGQQSFQAPTKSYVKGRKIDWDGLEADVIKTIEDMDNA